MTRTPLPWLWLWLLAAEAGQSQAPPAALVAAAAPAQTNRYCDICPEHTMCIYKSSGGPASRCRGLFSRELTREEVQAALHAHNAVRNKVAAGEERRGRFGQSQPPAANMHRLHWDEELATFARRWASQCVFDQDTCRTSADGTPVGQNIYMQVLPAGQAPHPTVSTTAAVRTWLDEVDEHDGRLSATPYTYSVPTWHYTMLVWGRTARVGCGFADFNAVGGLNARLVVCNYKEAGNVVGSPAYSVGRPASQCAGAPHAPMTPPPPPPPPVPPPPDAPLPPLPPPPVLDWPAYAGAAADTNMYSATTAPWWQLYPWLPTPAHGEDEARPLLLSRSATTKAAAASTTRARGRRGTEAANAASTGRSSSRAVGSRAMFLGAAEYSGAAGTARAAVTRALPPLPLAAAAGSPPGYVYPALCP